MSIDWDKLKSAWRENETRLGSDVQLELPLTEKPVGDTLPTSLQDSPNPRK